MNKEELKRRTKQFALMIIRIVEELPHTRAGNTIAYQLIRSGTSVAANYRSACRARSNADFVSKITVVEEESDESLFWLEMIADANLMDQNVLAPFIREANELTAIFTASGKTAKQNNPKSAIRNPQSAMKEIRNPQSAIRNERDPKSTISNPQ